VSQMCYEYHQLRLHTAPKLHQGLDSLVHSVAGYIKRNSRYGTDLLKEATLIYNQAVKFQILSDAVLRKRIQELLPRFRSKSRKDSTLFSMALALLTEAAYRKVGMRPFPVQVMGALALHRGLLAEMATGEGKTLTASLAAVIASWQGQPCHIITVNDYLAARDADWLYPLYSFCGISVGHVISTMPPMERGINYDSEVVYTTSKEILADFLRDRIKIGTWQHPSRRLIRSMVYMKGRNGDNLVMRGLGTAIVDEADSVLIDEAVTPLIISKLMQNRPLKEAIEKAFDIARDLRPGVHYALDKKYQEIRFTDKGMAAMKVGSQYLPGIWQGEARREEIVNQTLKAREFYHRDKQYVVQDNRAVIVDEFTGRLMPNRTWSQGLHQAVEVKEGLEVTDSTETLARLSFQRFFRLFPKLAGMTGTAQEATREFWQIYRLPVITIPTNKPCIRKLYRDRVFASEKEMWVAVAKEIVKVHQTDRPLLVGTRDVKASEQLAGRLAREGVDCQVINAIRHEEEARIVAGAGKKGRITIATNMAGRGTDIKLGRGVAALGGLHVIATERHKSIRIDRQLFGRCARQGDPGSAQAFISMEDELLRRFVPGALRNRLNKAWTIGGGGLIGKALCVYSQRAAERLAFRQRKNVLRNDTWLAEALSFTGSELTF